MNEQTTSRAPVTHIYPRAGVPDQTPIESKMSVDDAFDDIRRATFDGVVVMFETHQYAIQDFLELINQGSYDVGNLQILRMEGTTKRKVHIPARGPYEWKAIRASDDEVVGQKQVAAQEATTKEVEVEKYVSFADRRQARTIASQLPKSAQMVVVWEPNVEAGDLDYLNELPSDVPVVIYHMVGDKWGVSVTGDANPDNWQTEFPVMGECDLPKVEPIVDELLIAKGIHVWAGMFESYKTVATIELCSAILDNRPAFDHFKVRKQHEILYLCPDMSPELFRDYVQPFGLAQKKGFRWQKPNADVFHSIDSPVLERAVKDRILVLDTMLDYAQIQKAFESAEWIGFFKKLRRLMDVCGCVAIVMLVHPTKTGAKSNSIDPSEYLKDSVTFGGKIDVGLAFSKLDKTSQVFVQRIKGRGFKQQQFSFTIAYLDDEGNSNLDRGRFPVCLKPGEAGRKEDHAATSGRKANPRKQELTQRILQLRDGDEAKSFKEIGLELGLPTSTARAYYNEGTFKGEATTETGAA